MISTVSKKLLHLKTINKQSWMIYEIYNEWGDIIFYMGQPIDNKNCYRFGKTENELYDNIGKNIIEKMNQKVK